MAGVERFEPYQDKAGKWRWRLIDANNKNVGASGESFASRSNALRAAQNAKATAANAVISTPARRIVRVRPADRPLFSDLLERTARRR